MKNTSEYRDAADGLALDELHVHIDEAIVLLAATVPLVHALVDSHQRGLGFLGFEALQIQGQLYAKERADYTTALANGRPAALGGTTRAPGNLAGLSTEVAIWAAVGHQVGRLGRRLEHANIPTPAKRPVPVDQNGTVPSGTDTLLLLNRLRELVPLVNQEDLLAAALADLLYVQGLADTLIDTEDRIHLSAPCPHCGLHTLVFRLSDGTVTCDKEPSSKHRKPCVCSAPICGCKTDGLNHRHTWHRSRGSQSDGWYTLANLLGADRRDKESEHKENR